MRALMAVAKVAGIVLMLVGISGVPGDLATWAAWSGEITAEQWRWILLLVGLAIVLASSLPDLWPRVSRLRLSAGGAAARAADAPAAERRAEPPLVEASAERREQTRAAPPTNLPAELTSFVGRDAEIAEVRRLLATSRLLTLTGAGGTGKTRLAVRVASEVAGQHADGCFFVDLSTLTDPQLVLPAIGRSVNVPETPGRTMLESVQAHLRDKEILLLLDNFEHVTDAAPTIEGLLTAASRLTVLVTSRVVLGLRGEQEYVVSPLEPPDPQRLPDLETLGQIEAVRLFTDRAAAVAPEFRLQADNARAIAEITAQLDGLPLAIELAASRAKVLTPAQMLPLLRRSLSILTSGSRNVPQRQRTLQDTIAWSYDLLSPAERELFAQLSVFRGGWTLDSAQAVCDAGGFELGVVDGLAALVDQSLVRRTASAADDRRFSMLETIREYGLEQLVAGGALDDVARRHAAHYLGLAIQAKPHLTADDQREWLDRIDREHANIGAALRWAIDAGEGPRAQEAAGAMWRFWQQRGHLAEGRQWLTEVLAAPSGQERTAARAMALTGAGGIAWWQEDTAAAGAYYEEALAIERELGDPVAIAEALYNTAFSAGSRGDTETAFRMFNESLDLFRQAGDEPAATRVLWMLALQDAIAGDWESPVARAEEATRVWRRMGDRFHLGDGLVWLAVAYARAGRDDEARATIREALEVFREVDNRTGVGSVLLVLSFMARWQERYEDALRLAGAAHTVREQTGGRAPSDFLAIFAGDPEADARAHLPEETTRRAWEEGQTMSVDEAVALALD